MRGRIGTPERRNAMQATYEKWWLGKYVRQKYIGDVPYHKVIKVEFIAPPSGIYGSVELTFEDGKTEFVQTHYDGNSPWGQVYRPRKRDLDVQELP